MAALCVCVYGSTALGQVMSEEAELERLQNKAEEAIANEDAEAAAMNIGKAALMASQLARRQKDVGRAQWYRGAESRKNTAIAPRRFLCEPAASSLHHPGSAGR